MNRGQLVKTQDGRYGIILSSGDGPREIEIYFGGVNPKDTRGLELQEDVDVILQSNGLPVDFTEILNRGERFFI